jgi:putative spermidine/putrescine transport system substrate-binding protein
MRTRLHAVLALGALLTLVFGLACRPSAPASSTGAAPANPPAAGQAAGSQAAPSGQAGGGRTLRVSTWGGDWVNGVKTSTSKLFEERTGAKVDYVLGNPTDNLTKLLASRGDPPFDVMQMDNLIEDSMIERGLIEPIDRTRLPVGELFPEAADVTREYGPAFTMIPTVIAWVPAKYRELGLAPPTSFDDLFDPKLKGRVAYPSMRVGFAPLIISGLAYGWTGDQSAVEDAMRRLKQIDPRIYGATPEMATWLTNGEVYAAVTHVAQVVVMQNQGFELDFVLPQLRDKRGLIYWNMSNIVKGTKNRDLAEQWITISLGREAQDLMGRSNGVLPTNKAVAEEFSKDEKVRGLAMTPSDMNQMFQVGSRYINENREKWNDSWNRIMGN